MCCTWRRGGAVEQSLATCPAETRADHLQQSVDGCLRHAKGGPQQEVHGALRRSVIGGKVTTREHMPRICDGERPEANANHAPRRPEDLAQRRGHAAPAEAGGGEVGGGEAVGTNCQMLERRCKSH